MIANKVTRSEYEAMIKPRSKYGNKKLVIDEMTFDSTGEGERYLELKLMQTKGYISDLEVKPVYPLIPTMKIDGKTYKSARFTPDFRYTDCETGKMVVEEYKGCKTEAYSLRLKIFLMLYVNGRDDIIFMENIHRG